MVFIPNRFGFKGIVVGANKNGIILLKSLNWSLSLHHYELSENKRLDKDLIESYILKYRLRNVISQ